MTTPLPFVDLKAQYARLKPRMDARMRAVLDHGQFILGPEVQELEAELVRFSGAAHAITVSSGTVALTISLMAEGIGPGDAVFVPAFTFAATAGPVLAVGATPVFCDVGPDTFNMDPANLERAVADVLAGGSLRPRAVIPVDLFGLPADYTAITAVADAHGLFVLADAAQSFGASRDASRVGRLAAVTTTSFFPSKPLGCYGDGGAIFTDDAGLAEVMRCIRVHGQDADGACVRPGMNGRLDTLQAATLLAKLEAFEDEIRARESLARRYDQALRGTVTLPGRIDGAASVWAHYSIVVDNRDALRDALAARGIPARVYYPSPLHLQPAFRDYGGGPGSLPVSEELSRRILSLPIYPDLDEATVDRISDAVIAALK
ncbi:MAG: DegT/DnrJ/EryC1/StrS family aminotransferase [Alphaproteobacteria bacterium]|nr:DegT/DnrJ/EryC1/StrS family aminotransferase [Alphaproteobacteria bacterium]